jgi:Fe-S cluster biogenesis protein NfuA
MPDRSRHSLPLARGSTAHQSPTSSGPASAPPLDGPPADAQTIERVRRILDLIRPAVQDDGGDVELVDMSADGLVRVRFHGACVGCPSSSITLQTGIERNLRDHVPEVTSVIAIP